MYPYGRSFWDYIRYDVQTQFSVKKLPYSRYDNNPCYTDNCFKIKLSFFRLYLAGCYSTALSSNEQVGRFEGHGSRAAVSCLHSQRGGRN